MNIETLRSVCLAYENTSEELPFGPDTLVFKVFGKMFVAVGLNSHPLSINLKCDPEYALELRASHSSITPGYHMNKMHWNTIVLDNSLNQKLILELIKHSYEIVLKGVPKSKRH